VRECSGMGYGGLVGGLVWKDTGRETPITCTSLGLRTTQRLNSTGRKHPPAPPRRPLCVHRPLRCLGRSMVLDMARSGRGPMPGNDAGLSPLASGALERGERGEPNGPCARRLWESCCPHDAMPASPGLSTASRQGGGFHLRAYGRSNKAIHGRSVIPVQRLNEAFSREARRLEKRSDASQNTHAQNIRRSSLVPPGHCAWPSFLHLGQAIDR